jgi:hypothetical protein
LGDAIVMGLSSSGPAQTLAVSLAGLVAASGYGGPVPISDLPDSHARASQSPTND